MSEQYLRQILTRERFDDGPFSFVHTIQSNLRRIMDEWAGVHLVGFTTSGSFAKGTAVASGTDVDFFISLAPSCTMTLGEIYESLFARMAELGYAPKRQRVSIGIRVWDGQTKTDVDLVPGRQQEWFGADHSLHLHKGGVWTKTNVAEHIRVVRDAGRSDEIRLFKIWRNLRGFDWPSFHVELTVIEALRHVWVGSLDGNVVTVLGYLRDNFQTARVVDPANGANVLSDDMAAGTKMLIAREAGALLGEHAKWSDFVR